MITSPSEPKYSRLLWGSMAFLIYFLLIGLLLFYFNHRDEEKPKHFVKKDEKRIHVTSSVPVKAIKVNTIAEKPKIEKPKIEKVKIEKVKIEKPKSIKKPKQVVKPKIEPVKKNVVIKEKVVKKKPVKKVEKKKDVNRTKPKKVKINKPKEKKKIEKPKIEKPKNIITTSDLFSSVKVTKNDVNNEVKKKIDIQTKPISASQKIDNSMKEQKNSDAGIENAYFAKVQSLLETWPAQSDYAGERATVHLFVKPSGMFEFKVKSQSDNVDFNLGLIDFLMQLQKAGLGRHDAGKTYEFKVEFIAKE